MKDQDKTKRQLIDELVNLRRRNEELEKSNVDSKRLEKELKSSAEKYRDIVNLAPDGIVTVNLKGTVTSCNPSFLSLSGYSADEIIGKHFTKLPTLHLRDLPKYIKMFNSLIRGKSQKAFEIEWAHKDKTTHQAEILTSIMRKGRKIVGIQAIARDITEHKQIEHLYQIQHNLAVSLNMVVNFDKGLNLCLDAAINASGMDCGGIYLFDKTSGAFDLVSHKGLSADFIKSISHYEADTENVQLVMKGKPIYTEHLALGVPLDESQKREGLRAIAVLPIHHEDQVIGCMNISSHTLDEFHVSVRSSLEAITAQIGISIAQLKAEKALRESEAKYRSIIESTDDSVYSVDEDCRYIYMNEKNLSRLGLPSDKVIGKMYGNFHSKEGTEKFKNRIKQVLRTGKSVTHEYQSERDGKFFLRTYSPIRKPHDKPNAVTVISKDITKRRRVEEQLIKSQDELRKLAEHLQTVREEERTKIAQELHDDVGQSLAALKIDMYLLERDIPKDQMQIRDKLESLMEFTDRVTDMVGAIYTELRPPLLDELGLKGVVGWYQRIFQEWSGIKCDFQIELDGVDLSDYFSLALFRILQESMVNVKLHSEATRMKASLREKDGRIELIVKDNGIGITEDQVKESKAFGIKGMEERVRYLGGDIKIKGIEGEGTTVTVRIPLQADNQDQSR